MTLSEYWGNEDKESSHHYASLIVCFEHTYRSARQAIVLKFVRKTGNNRDPWKSTEKCYLVVRLWCMWSLRILIALSLKKISSTLTKQHLCASVTLLKSAFNCLITFTVLPSRNLSWLTGCFCSWWGVSDTTVKSAAGTDRDWSWHWGATGLLKINLAWDTN